MKVTLLQIDSKWMDERGISCVQQLLWTPSQEAIYMSCRKCGVPDL